MQEINTQAQDPTVYQTYSLGLPWLCHLAMALSHHASSMVR